MNMSLWKGLLKMKERGWEESLEEFLPNRSFISIYIETTQTIGYINSFGEDHSLIK